MKVARNDQTIVFKTGSTDNLFCCFPLKYTDNQSNGSQSVSYFIM